MIFSCTLLVVGRTRHSIESLNPIKLLDLLGDDICRVDKVDLFGAFLCE